MSNIDPGEPREQDIINAARVPVKSRIPQSLQSARQRTPAFKPKAAMNSKSLVVSAQQPRFIFKSMMRPRSGEQTRPKSANRTKDDIATPKQAHSVARPARPEKEKLLPAPRRPSTIPKRIMNENIVPNKTTRPIIMVPLTQKQPTKTVYTNRTLTCLPDQETINRHEDLELQHLELVEGVRSPGTDLNEGGSCKNINSPVHVLLKQLNSITSDLQLSQQKIQSITSRSDIVTQLKITWQEKIVQFEKMKNELNDRQQAIMELYAALGVTHQKMYALGQRTSLPPADELRIMNVANMTPEQLLQLCAETNHADEKRQQDGLLTKTAISIDMNKLYKILSKLVGTCEQTLLKRNEFILSLESITKKRDVNLSFLKIIKEFNAENEMLACSLEKVKNEFCAELNNIVPFISKCVNDTMAAQLRNEQLTYELSELNALKDDLRKQIQSPENYKCNTNKTKVKELEKQLKEEKVKLTLIRDRQVRAEGQVKISAEQTSQLEAALEQARSKCWNLERTVLQLREQNQKLQKEFDTELNKFTQYIQENMSNLEDITHAREKLQAEKEDLEKRLTELSTSYNESLKHVKHEMNVNVSKLIEIENRLENEKQEKHKLEGKVESLCSQLLESELRYKDLREQLQEKESELSEATERNRELEAAKHSLDVANKEMDDYRKRLAKQSETVMEIECQFKEALMLEQDLRRNLTNKDEYIVELEKKQTLLETQLQESECKMGAYEEQLTCLKKNIAQLQEDFGEFDNFNELHEMINQQRAKLLETTRQNGELAAALQKKDLELEQHVESITEQERTIEQRNDIIKMLSDKEEEHANIIKLLRNNLEMNTRADIDLNQQLIDKNSEIESLITNLEMRKQQISELEKIILTLEDQTRKASAHKRKDQEKIQFLENKIAEYETYLVEQRERSIEAPEENLDSIIKILEDELGTPFYPRPHRAQPSDYTKKDFAKNQVNQSFTHDKYEHRSKSRRQSMYEGHQKISTKIATDAYIKTHEEHKGDHLDRKKADMNIDSQQHVLGAELNVHDVPPTTQENISPKIYLSRNLNFIPPIHFREDKKCRMFKFAGHRI